MPIAISRTIAMRSALDGTDTASQAYQNPTEGISALPE
jgi:hypothetical protein